MKTLIYIKKPTSHKHNLLEDSLKSSQLKHNENCLFLQDLDSEILFYQPEILVSNIFSKELYKRFPNIEHIIVPTSGLDGIDLNLISNRSINLYHNPKIFSNEVVKSVLKNLSDIENKKIGLYGFGNIGQGIYESLCRNNYFYIYKKRQELNAKNLGNILYYGNSLEKVITNSNIHIISLPKNSETINIFSEDEFNNIKPKSQLISISRKELIDEIALIEAIKKGDLTKVNLDSYSELILDFAKNNKVLGLNNHSSGITLNSIQNMTNWIISIIQELNN